MKAKFLFIIIPFFFIACNKEKQAERKLRKERKDILEMRISNHRSQEIKDIKISLIHPNYTTSHTQSIPNVLPGEKITFLYNCQGKIERSTDYQFEIKFKLDTIEDSLYFYGIYMGKLELKALELDFYKDTFPAKYVRYDLLEYNKFD